MLLVELWVFVVEVVQVLDQLLAKVASFMVLLGCSQDQLLIRKKTVDFSKVLTIAIDECFEIGSQYFYSIVILYLYPMVFELICQAFWLYYPYWYFFDFLLSKIPDLNPQKVFVTRLISVMLAAE